MQITGIIGAMDVEVAILRSMMKAAICSSSDMGKRGRSRLRPATAIG